MRLATVVVCVEISVRRIRNIGNRCSACSAWLFHKQLFGSVLAGVILKDSRQIPATIAIVVLSSMANELVKRSDRLAEPGTGATANRHGEKNMPIEFR